MKYTHLKHIKGFSLTELLISSVVLSVGMIGLAGLQLKSMQNSHDAHLKSLASMEANSLAESMRSNMAGVTSGAYHNLGKPGATAKNYDNCFGDISTQSGSRQEIIAKSDGSGIVYNADGTISEMDPTTGDPNLQGIGYTQYADGTIVYNNGTVVSPVGSTADHSCTATEMASSDLLLWQQEVAELLPEGESTLCIDSNPGASGALGCNGVGNVYVIDVQWRNRLGGTSNYRTTLVP